MSKKLKLTLKENGLHSLEKGLKVFSQFEKTDNDDLLLKDSIMFLHHGIELLMKQVLLEKNSEILIYSDISNETVKKVIKAKKDNISVFNLDKPVHTATYTEVIERVFAFINNPELPENLRTWLGDFNKIRNQIEHYAIDREEEELKKLIQKIRKPLIDFFDASINDFEKSNIEENWKDVNKFIQSEFEVKKIEKMSSLEIVIICEGQNDKRILKFLTDYILTKYKIERSISILVANGVAYYNKALRKILLKSNQVNQKIVVVTDSDFDEESRKQQLSSMGIEDKYQIIIEPFIEAWLINDKSVLKDIKSIKYAKKEIRDAGGYAVILQKINIETLMEKEKAFKKLVDLIIES